MTNVWTAEQNRFIRYALNGNDIGVTLSLMDPIRQAQQLKAFPEQNNQLGAAEQNRSLLFKWERYIGPRSLMDPGPAISVSRKYLELRWTNWKVKNSSASRPPVPPHPPLTAAAYPLLVSALRGLCLVGDLQPGDTASPISPAAPPRRRGYSRQGCLRQVGLVRARDDFLTV